MRNTDKIAKLLNFNVLQCTPNRDAEIAEYERKREIEENAERYRRFVPERYWNESLDTYRTDTKDRKDAVEKVRAFARGLMIGRFDTLLLLGAAGTGKTHLACGIIRERGGIYKRSSELMEKIRRARAFGAKKSEAEIVNRYGNVGLLIIDEIGRGIAAEEEQYMLYRIIDERYNSMKPMVLISNMPKKDFLSYVGIAVADRLSESAQVVELSGASYRATIRKQTEERNSVLNARRFDHEEQT